MNSIRVLVVEDEILISETIRLYLEERGHVFVDGAISYDEGILFYNKYKPDIVLLDIRLYGQKSGIDFAHYLINSGNNTPFIFLTSQFDKKILDLALQTEPDGYLTKPIQKESLWTTIELAHNKKASNNHTLSINDGTQVHIIDESDIKYITADHVYIKVYLDSGKVIFTRFSLLQIFEELKSKSFIQCHRSFIVNINYVDSWQADNLLIQGENIPVSRSRRKEVFDKLNAR